jgi:hypothetical protein
MKTAYTFSVLKYTFDPLTQESVNVGIAVYSTETRQLEARCTHHYKRVSDLFGAFDGVRFRQTMRFLQDAINDRAREMATELEFSQPAALHEILNRVLPVDDSSLRFVQAGVGLTEDFAATVELLFERYVDRYTKAQTYVRRGDDDVWRTFKSSLDRRAVTRHLVPKRIVAKDFEFEFDRSWKNKIWHVYEPLSFDLLDGTAMAEKANRWVGRATGLADSSEDFELHILLGSPSDSRLQSAYIKAENLLNRMPIPHTFVRESEADDFARSLSIEISKHEKHEEHQSV